MANTTISFEVTEQDATDAQLLINELFEHAQTIPTIEEQLQTYIVNWASLYRQKHPT